MSYNISSWKMTHFHLALPLDFDFQQWLTTQPNRDKDGENVGKRWCLEEESRMLVTLPAFTWELPFIGDNGLSGTVERDLLNVTGIHCRGEFSGPLYSDILLPLFKEFKGTLDAMVIWEGGDTVERVSIQDGNVSTETIK